MPNINILKCKKNFHEEMSSTENEMYMTKTGGYIFLFRLLY